MQSPSSIDTAKQLWAPFAEKYDIHQETYELQAKLIDLGCRPQYELGVEKSREQSQWTAKEVQGTVEFPGEQSEVTVPSPYDPEGIAVSVYKPDNCAENPTILIHFHGGGLVLGSRHSIATPLKIIAMDSGAIVVNADYRLLPNTEAPSAPFEDGITVTRWVMANKTALGGTDSSKVGVSGDSSGGHIAAVVTNEVVGLDFQVLIYPLVDTALSHDSFKEFAGVPILSQKTLSWFIENSMAHIPNHGEDPRYNPMARTNTEQSPPALIVVAELDPLIGSGLDYAEKLRAAGVPVQCETLRGVPHAVFTSRTVTKTMSARAYSLVVDFLRRL